MNNYKIDDNGTVRDMTPEEIAAWEAECAEFAAEETPTPEDYEAALARLGVE